MHISEGVLSGPMLLSGAALALAGTAIGMKKLNYDKITEAGMLSAAFFVASLVHVPIGPSNAHLILSGLVGLMLDRTFHEYFSASAKKIMISSG